jgi:hypothetical protein
MSDLPHRYPISIPDHVLSLYSRLLCYAACPPRVGTKCGTRPRTSPRRRWVASTLHQQSTRYLYCLASQSSLPVLQANEIKHLSEDSDNRSCASGHMSVHPDVRHGSISVRVSVLNDPPRRTECRGCGLGAGAYTRPQFSST